MIRARFDSPWHDYRNVFDDLRNGKLSMDEYDIMVNEDALEADRRRSGLVVAVDALDKRLADSEETTEDTDRGELEEPCTCNLCTDFAEKEPKAYVSTEESRAQVALRLLPTNVLTPKVAITFDPNGDYTHAIDLVNDEAVILIRNESSGAY